MMSYFKDNAIIILLGIFFLFQCVTIAQQSQRSHPPDELAHMAYVDDVVSGKGRFLLPDYENGIIHGNVRNHLNHPPLYYSTLGVFGKILDINTKDHYFIFRVLNALFAALALMMFLKAFKNMGLAPNEMVLATLATMSIPIVSYMAGSINNDNLMYLGVGLFFLGMSLEPFKNKSINAISFVYITLGLIITFLSKATGALFLVAFSVVYLLIHWRIVLTLFTSLVFWKSILALAVFVGGYYLYAKLQYGSFFPKSGDLYQINVVENPIPFINYMKVYYDTMVRRLPIVMSHLSYAPLPIKFFPLFYALFVIPLFGWFIVRFLPGCRTERTHNIKLIDSFFVAAIVVISIHMMYGYWGYSQTGLYAGLQPRYYIFLMPVIFMSFFAITREGILKQSVFVVMFLCALIVFWGWVTNSQKSYADQRTAALATSVYQTHPELQFNTVEIAIRESYNGVLDSLAIHNGVLSSHGWIMDLKANQKPERILITAKGQFLGAVPVSTLRQDVENAFNTALGRYAGFIIRISRVPSDVSACDITLYAEFPNATFVPMRWVECDAQ